MKDVIKYDAIVVGAGLYGCAIARLLAESDLSVLVIDKRDKPGGNCSTSKIDDITVHDHGAHIFHTSDERVWKFVNRFAKWRTFQNNVKALSNGKMYSMPFNMNTYNEIWGICDITEAMWKLDEEREPYINIEPTNLEEQALKLVGPTIYDLLVKRYTQKQWGKSCKDLSPDIIKRLPLRNTWNNNYFNDVYQALPVDGYTEFAKKMLDHDNIVCAYNRDFNDSRNTWTKHATMLIYTGPIDEFFNYEYGRLEYRSLRFEHHTFCKPLIQGTPVINYCDNSVAYTRSIEHKCFLNEKSNFTIVTYEYPELYDGTNERYYPVNNVVNEGVYQRYKHDANKLKRVLFGGRLGTYSYLNMDQVIKMAMLDAETVISRIAKLKANV